MIRSSFRSITDIRSEPDCVVGLPPGSPVCPSATAPEMTTTDDPITKAMPLSFVSNMLLRTPSVNETTEVEMTAVAEMPAATRIAARVVDSIRAFAEHGRTRFANRDQRDCTRRECHAPPSQAIAQPCLPRASLLETVPSGTPRRRAAS